SFDQKAPLKSLLSFFLMFQVLSSLFFVIFVIIIDRQETQSNYEGAFSDEKISMGNRWSWYHRT
ncbi:hypothetical protein NNE61_08470, partial [Enterococcus faecium]|nr:hypothetical protein [Enterococcus faecium]MDT6853875.1 hypothetical protein [Enterococcus faecium]MDV4500097.1 hypothetical protein [Enterococcus faecium]MDV4505160.1 hypothetical protein [Enterococcus faecium]MDV4678333.1 hypothetical protein [Enterococcus faecium]